MPKYVFKALPELGWAVTVSVSTVVLLALAQLDPTAIVDWRTWAIGLGTGAVRAGAGAALDWLQRRKNADPVSEIFADIQNLSPEDRIRLREAVEREGAQ